MIGLPINFRAKFILVAKIILAFKILVLPLISCKQQSAGAIDLLGQRILGNKSKDFTFTKLAENNSGDQIIINSNKDKVEIQGTTNVAQAYGLYSYLKKIGAGMVNWEGRRLNLPEIYPEIDDLSLETPFTYRTYLNVCAFGYSTPWWDWERWEEEIDWMALHGVNMPTAMEGQEAILQELWAEFGLTSSELDRHFVGPAFLPWQRMGNINGHMGPLPQSWIEKKKNLQKKILKRMHEFGMKPVVPAFNGYVPKSFAKKHSDAKIHRMESWGGGLEETYWLDPKDELFEAISKRFLQLYTDTYGDEQFFLIDAFNEMTPPVSEKSKLIDLKSYGTSIYQTLKESNPGAVWVMQGWMFGHDKDYWTPESVQAFLSGIPDDKMIIQDFSNDRYEVWKDVDAFYGKEWIFGYIHNYGGTNPVFGDLSFYNEQIKQLSLDKTKKNLKGFGMMPEGIDNNSVVYEYAYDLAWNVSGLNPTSWLQEYVVARYGESGSSMNEAWDLLLSSVYSTKYWASRWWGDNAGTYVFNKRPSINVVDFNQHPGDFKALDRAIDLMMKEKGDFVDQDFFKHDLIEMTRHRLSIKLDSLLIECVKAYNNSNIDQGDSLFNEAKDLSSEIDSLLAEQSHNSLSKWLSSAWDYGESEKQSKKYLKNAKMQVTLWGGDHLKDYASKSWHGMNEEFYWPRWRMFFDELRNTSINQKPFEDSIQSEKIRVWEVAWSESEEQFKPVSNGNYSALVERLISKY